MAEQPVGCLHSRTFTAARQGFPAMRGSTPRMLTFIVQGGGGVGARFHTVTRAAAREGQGRHSAS
eukprot:2673317-Rhodomonas_salina.1